MFKKIQSLESSKYYWLFLIVLGISLEVTALIYQYLLDYYPCVLCIHIRIVVMAVILLSLLALKFQHSVKARLIFHLLMSIIMEVLFERSYNLLGVERGFVSGDCSMNSGLPGWFAIDQWFPWMFKIWEPCGYTPEILFGITMAESLIVLSAVLLLLSILLFAVSLKKLKNNHG